MKKAYTPSFKHFQRDIEGSLKSEGKCKKNEHGQIVFYGYEPELQRMFRVYMEREAYAPLVAEFKTWNWEWGYTTTSPS